MGREPNPEDPPYREKPPGGPPWPGYPNPPPPGWVPPLKLAKGKKSKFYKKVFYNIYLILANSGLRISSLLKLKWSDVVVKGSKSGKVKINSDGTITQALIAIISVPVETKTSFRRFASPTGKWFNNLKEIYKEETGSTVKKTDYIFQNIGTDNSKGNKFVGNPLSQSFILRTFYEMLEELEFYKGISFDDFDLKSSWIF